MGKSRKEVMEQCQKVKELYCKGYTIEEIAQLIGVCKGSVYNSFTIMGMSLKKRLIDESNLVYVDNKPPVLEKVIIDGKRYTDITPIFSPR